MTSRFNRTLRVAIGAAFVSTAVALPAHADWVFKFGNHSDVEAKGVVQQVQVLYLKRNQVTDVRVKGVWSGGSCFAGSCTHNHKSEYTVNFEHLSNAGFQYCVWTVKSYVNAPSSPNKVVIVTKLTHEADGYKCEVGGQSSAHYNARDANGEGITQNFTFKKK